MSRDDDDGITVVPVLTVIHRRHGEEEGRARIQEEENTEYYFKSCVYLFCQAVDSVLLHVCCCSCLRPFVGNLLFFLQPRNGPQKVFLFCMKHLSNLCVTAIVYSIARWAFLRPLDVKPMLGTCTINQFELQWPPADAMVMPGSSSAAATHPMLRFNLTTHLLFKNSHRHYAIGYNYPAVAVLYAGEKLGPVDDEIPAFRQDPLRSTVVDQVIVGQLRNPSTTVVEMFAGERAKGLFHMVMRIRVTLSYKFWPFKADYFTFYDCPLSTPLPNTGKPALSTPVYCNTVEI